MKFNKKQKIIIKEINNYLKEDDQLLYLIQGDLLTGKTEIINKLKTDKNIIIVNSSNFVSNVNKNIKNKNLYSFFGISQINNYKEFTVKLNNENIFIFHDKYETGILNYESNNYRISPYKESDDYYRIINSKEKKFNSFTNNYKNNLLIIDDVHLIDRKILYYINYNLKIVFDKNKLFGGINVILIGNNFDKTNKNNVFTYFYFENSILDSFLPEKRNDYILKKKTIKLKDEECKLFIKNKLSIMKFDINNNKKLYNNLFKFEEKNFQNHKYPITIYDFKKEASEMNKRYIKDKSNYFFTIVSKIYKSNFFNLLDEYNKNYYLNFYDNKLYLIEKEEVFFIKSVEEYNIKIGTIGIIERINYKKYNKEKKYSSKEVTVDVLINGEIFNIKEVPLICTYNNNIIFSNSQLPFIIFKNISFKYLKYIQDNIKTVYSLNFLNRSKNISNYIYKINDINRIAFQNTHFIPD